MTWVASWVHVAVPWLHPFPRVGIGKSTPASHMLPASVPSSVRDDCRQEDSSNMFAPLYVCLGAIMIPKITCQHGFRSFQNNRTFAADNMWLTKPIGRSFLGLLT